jgi:hypothetical protein
MPHFGPHPTAYRNGTVPTEVRGSAVQQVQDIKAKVDADLLKLELMLKAFPALGAITHSSVGRFNDRQR